jgi:hypothetical protein
MVTLCVSPAVHGLSFLALKTKNTIATITAMTMKMPKPIPALKIADMAAQELMMNERKNNTTAVS